MERMVLLGRRMPVQTTGHGHGPVRSQGSRIAPSHVRPRVRDRSTGSDTPFGRGQQCSIGV